MVQLVYVIGMVVRAIFQLYLLALIIRAVLSWIPIFNPTWQPRNSIFIWILNFIYRITDPPLRLAGRFFRPLRMGGVGIDLSFIIVFLAVLVLSNLVSRLWFYLVATLMHG